MRSNLSLERRKQWPTCASNPTRGLPGVVAGVVTLAVLTVAFGAMALGVPYFWVAFPVGFGVVLPVAVGLARRFEPSSARTGTPEPRSPGDETGPTASRDGTLHDEALQTLRGRYARGELDEAEFERRVERLLETETVQQAADWTRADSRRPVRDGTGTDTGATHDRNERGQRDGGGRRDEDSRGGDDRRNDRGGDEGPDRV
jgi:hypothetical protein